VLQGAREADLVPIMEEFIEEHPAVTFSSLPKFIEGGTEVHLGLSGILQDVENGIRDLIGKLEAMGVTMGGVNARNKEVALKRVLRK